MIEIYFPESIVRFFTSFYSKTTKTNKSIKAVYRGNEKMAFRDYDKALSFYNLALIYESNNPLIFFNKGLCYFNKGNDALAEKNYLRSIELGTQRLDIKKDAYYNLGVLYAKLQDLKRSNESYTAAIKIHAGNASVFNNRGFNYLQLGAYEKAKSDFIEAIRLFRTDAFALNNLGFTYFKLGKAEKGLLYIDKSLALNPNNSYAYKNKAIILLHLNRKNEAIELLWKAKSLNYAALYGDEVDVLLNQLEDMSDSDNDILDHFL